MKKLILNILGDPVYIDYTSMRDDVGIIHVAIVCSDCYEDEPAKILPEPIEVTGNTGTITLQIPESAQPQSEIYFCFLIGYEKSGEEWDTTKAGPIYVQGMLTIIIIIMKRINK